MSLLDKFTIKRHNSSRAREVLDSTPITIPVNLRRSESMDERIARIVQHSVSKQAADQGLETFEEADDFDIPDDPLDPSSPWETDFDMAAANAVDRGVVQKPDLSPDRYRELQEKYPPKGSKKSDPSKKPEDEPPLPLEE